MMCGIAAIVAMFLRKQLRFKYAIFLMALLFFPTTLNETKATLLLLPLAIVVPLYFMPRGSRALRRAVPIFAVGAVALVAFIAVYDYFIQYATTGQPIGQFVGEASFSRYLYSGAAEEGEANYIGRFDSVQFAMDHITKDPLKLAFGYGAGNVSLSFLPQFNGAYAAYYDRYGVGMTQVTTFLWEIGVVGLLTYLMLYAFVLHDARMLSRLDGEAGLLGQIWATVAVIMVFGLIYKSIFSMTEIGYLFWFYTGVVAARAVEHRVSLRATARRNRPRLQQGGRPSDARYGGLAEAKP
jgi:hypothetical protein